MKCNNCNYDAPNVGGFCPNCGERMEVASHKTVAVPGMKQRSMNPVEEKAVKQPVRMPVFEKLRSAYNKMTQNQRVLLALAITLICSFLMIFTIACLSEDEETIGENVGKIEKGGDVSVFLDEWICADRRDNKIITISEAEDGLAIHEKSDNFDYERGDRSYRVYSDNKYTYVVIVRGNDLYTVFALLSPNILVELWENTYEPDEKYTLTFDWTEYRGQVRDYELYIRKDSVSKEWPLSDPPGDRVIDYLYCPQEQILCVERNEDFGYICESHYIISPKEYFDISYIIPLSAKEPRVEDGYSYDIVLAEHFAIYTFGTYTDLTSVSIQNN